LILIALSTGLVLLARSFDTTDVQKLLEAGSDRNRDRRSLKQSLSIPQHWLDRAVSVSNFVDIVATANYISTVVQVGWGMTRIVIRPFLKLAREAFLTLWEPTFFSAHFGDIQQAIAPCRRFETAQSLVLEVQQVIRVAHVMRLATTAHAFWLSA
jgi:hypothetical protein